MSILIKPQDGSRVTGYFEVRDDAVSATGHDDIDF